MKNLVIGRSGDRVVTEHPAVILSNAQVHLASHTSYRPVYIGKRFTWNDHTSWVWTNDADEQAYSLIEELRDQVLADPEIFKKFGHVPQ